MNRENLGGYPGQGQYRASYPNMRGNAQRRHFWPRNYNKNNWIQNPNLIPPAFAPMVNPHLWSEPPPYHNRYSFPVPVPMPMPMPPMKPPSPLPGTDEFTQRNIQQTVEILQKEFDAGSNSDIILPTASTSRTEMDFTHEDINNGKRSGRSNHKTANTKLAELQHLSGDEILEKIQERLAKVSYKKKLDLVNSQGSDAYNTAIHQLYRQNRVGLSRELKDLSHKKVNIKNCEIINAIIPDMVINLEELPDEVKAKLSETLSADLEPMIDPEMCFRQAENMLSTNRRYEGFNYNFAPVRGHHNNQYMPRPTIYDHLNLQYADAEKHSHSNSSYPQSHHYPRVCRIRSGRCESRDGSVGHGGSLQKIKLKNRERIAETPQPVPPPPPIIDPILFEQYASRPPESSQVTRTIIKIDTQHIVDNDDNDSDDVIQVPRTPDEIIVLDEIQSGDDTHDNFRYSNSWRSCPPDTDRAAKFNGSNHNSRTHADLDNNDDYSNDNCWNKSAHKRDENDPRHRRFDKGRRGETSSQERRNEYSRDVSYENSRKREKSSSYRAPLKHVTANHYSSRENSSSESPTDFHRNDKDHYDYSRASSETREDINDENSAESEMRPLYIQTIFERIMPAAPLEVPSMLKPKQDEVKPITPSTLPTPLPPTPSPPPPPSVDEKPLSAQLLLVDDTNEVLDYEEDEEEDVAKYRDDVAEESHLSGDEILDKKQVRLGKVSFMKKLDLVNSQGSDTSNTAIHQLHRQNRVSLSRKLKDLSHKKVNIKNCEISNAFIPDMVINLKEDDTNEVLDYEEDEEEDVAKYRDDVAKESQSNIDTCSNVEVIIEPMNDSNNSSNLIVAQYEEIETVNSVESEIGKVPEEEEKEEEEPGELQPNDTRILPENKTEGTSIIVLEPSGTFKTVQIDKIAIENEHLYCKQLIETKRNLQTLDKVSSHSSKTSKRAKTQNRNSRSSSSSSRRPKKSRYKSRSKSVRETRSNRKIHEKKEKKDSVQNEPPEVQDDTQPAQPEVPHVEPEEVQTVCEPEVTDSVWRQRYVTFKRKTRLIMKKMNAIDAKIFRLLEQRMKLAKECDATLSECDTDAEEQQVSMAEPPEETVSIVQPPETCIATASTSTASAAPVKQKTNTRKTKYITISANSKVNPVLNSNPPSCDLTEVFNDKIILDWQPEDNLPLGYNSGPSMDIFSILNELPVTSQAVEMDTMAISSVMEMSDNPLYLEDVLKLERIEGNSSIKDPRLNPVVNVTNYNIEDLEKLRDEYLHYKQSDDDIIPTNLPHTMAESSIVMEQTFDDVFMDVPEPQAAIHFNGWKDSILVVKVIDNIVIAGNDKGKLYYHDITSGDVLFSVTQSTKQITSISIWKGNQVLLFIGSLDGRLYIFDFLNRKNVKKVSVGLAIQCLEVHWGIVFLGSAKGDLIHYDIKNERLSEPIQISETAVLAIKPNVEGSRHVILVATRHCPVTVRDAVSGLLLRTIGGELNPTIYALHFYNNRIYCGTSQNDVLVYNFQDGQLLNHHKESAGSGVVCMAQLKHLMFVACYNGNIYVYNTMDNSFITSISGPGGLFLCMDVSDNKIIAGTKHHYQCIPLPTSVLRLL